MSGWGAGRLRIDEVDAKIVLPQILHLRALVGRRISLATDAARWLDPHDAHAMHWGVFREAVLVAAARLSVHSDIESLPDAALFDALDDDLPGTGSRGPVALMSHCAVQPVLRDLRLESMLDIARIERARQLRLGAVLAIARSARRVAALEAQGFDALEPSADGRRGLVFHTRRESRANIVRMRVPSRT